MRKQIDNLTRDAMAALACGMSYGKYMASRTGRTTPAGRSECPVITVVNEPGEIAICRGCGKAFTRKREGHIYCSDRCGSRTRERERRMKEKEKANA